MRDDFCVFILTHGRPDRVYTYKTLRKRGYTGKIYIVIDDEDETENEYRAIYGDEVLQFCKKDVAEWTDDGDNFGHRKGVVYARNVCWELAEKVGCKYFIQLDDDYKNFRYRFNALGESCSVNIHSTINDLFQTCLNFRLCSTHIKTVALAQGGDMTSLTKKRYLRRKAMNSFFCDTSNPFNFFGRINEDVNTYVCQGRKGEVFFTIMNAQLDQIQTQKNAGGLTEQYLD